MNQRSYENEIRRAILLGERHFSAAEVLGFYRHILNFQKSLSLALERTVAKEKNLGKLRDRIEVSLLLPHMRGFLAMTQQHAPAPLSTFARELYQQSSKNWIQLLNQYIQEGHKDGALDPRAQLLSNAIVRPYASLLRDRSPVPPQISVLNTCPLCDSRPLLGVLRPEGDGGKRFLYCPFCDNEWEFRRIFCANCGEAREDKLPVYVAEQLLHLRVECCDTCKLFLRSVDLTRDGNAVPVVDDLAALPLSIWAGEHGYTRIEPNLPGT
jgi:formate dehydrogenase maturation protein FdhE